MIAANSLLILDYFNLFSFSDAQRQERWCLSWIITKNPTSLNSRNFASIQVKWHPCYRCSVRGLLLGTERCRHSWRLSDHAVLARQPYTTPLPPKSTEGLHYGQMATDPQVLIQSKCIVQFCETIAQKIPDVVSIVNFVMPKTMCMHRLHQVQ